MSKLFIVNPPDGSRSYEFKGDTIQLGRAPHNDIQINDKSVSRNHLKVIKKKKKFFIVDLESTNGTFVRNEQIAAGREFEVNEGEPVAIGNIFLSIGKEWSGNVVGIQESIELAVGETGSAHMIEKDRPVTPPKDLDLIYKVSNVLMQSLDINKILEQILEYIFDFLQRIDRGVIILIDNKTGKIIEVISRFKESSDDTIMMYSRSVVDKVMKEGKAVIMSDTLGEREAELSDSMELMKIKSVMCVPLISRSQTRGVIYVDSVNKPFGFRKEDLSLLTALSSPAAIAIENALLYADLEKKVEERTKTLSETENKLRASEARFKAIFDNMSSGVIVFQVTEEGKEFIVLDLNSAHQKIETIKKKEVLGKSVREILPNIEQMGLLDVLKRVWETGRPEHTSTTLVQNEVITGWREYYVYRLPSKEIVAIFDDVTGKKRAEAEQKALQKQLLAAQKMETIGAFAGGTAHNFRNILQAISGNIEYLEMVYNEKPEVRDLAKSIYDSVEKGSDLINSLLHFSKRGGEYQLEDIDLADVIMKTYEIIDRVFDKNIDLKFDLEKHLYVKGNPSLLSQVFMNLLTNARDAMPQGGRLHIDAKRVKNRVITTVSDTGHGMDKETVEKIFDPFFTLKDVGKGTGLGLSTTHGIVEQHKGSISVSSKPNKGAKFKISLPFVKTGRPMKPKPQREIILGKGQKVLIVDDERPTLEALTNIIKRLGYKTVSADRAMEVLQNYSKWAPDVVLMDRGMPEMDGITCLREIMKTDPDAKIVIVSGYEESGADGIDEDVKKLIRAYLTKPCSMDEISHTLARVLEEA
ncbi:ATP-binding protein [Thermodesulfobacteriota bacterium]